MSISPLSLRSPLGRESKSARSTISEAVDLSSALVFVADDAMQYLAVNRTACETLGYTRAELLSMRVTDIAVSVAAPNLYREMMETRFQQGDVMLRTKDGKLLPFFYSASER